MTAATITKLIAAEMHGVEIDGDVVASGILQDAVVRIGCSRRSG